MRWLQWRKHTGVAKDSRPVPDIGPGCHELRIADGSLNWRIMYHIAPDAIVILDVFPKKTAATPKSVIAECHKRLAEFQRVVKDQKGASRARPINVEKSNGPDGLSGTPVTSWACPPMSGASSTSSSHWRTGCDVDGSNSG